MVLLSKKVDYAILALVHLMNCPRGTCARELASRYGLSRPFVANILKQLCQAGFIESRRGAGGGYRLAVDPSRLSIRAVIAALDGPLQLMDCAETDSAAACCVLPTCIVRSPLHQVHDRIVTMLSEISLADLAKPVAAPLVPLQIGKA